MKEKVSEKAKNTCLCCGRVIPYTGAGCLFCGSAKTDKLLDGDRKSIVARHRRKYKLDQTRNRVPKLDLGWGIR